MGGFDEVANSFVTQGEAPSFYRSNHKSITGSIIDGGDLVVYILPKSTPPLSCLFFLFFFVEDAKSVG